MPAAPAISPLPTVPVTLAETYFEEIIAWYGHLPTLRAELHAWADGVLTAAVAAYGAGTGQGGTAVAGALAVGLGEMDIPLASVPDGYAPGQYVCVWCEAAQNAMWGEIVAVSPTGLCVDVFAARGQGAPTGWHVFQIPRFGVTGPLGDLLPCDAAQAEDLVRDAAGQSLSAASVYSLFAPAGLPAGTAFVRASAAWTMGAAGVVLPAAVNEPRIGGLGLLVEGPTVRLNQIAAAPAAPEDVTLPAGTFTASFFGTGSLALSGAHEATVQGVGASPARAAYTFELAAGVVTLTPTGEVLHLQLEAGQAATSPILGEGAPVVRAADVATHDLAQLDWLPETGKLYVAGRAAAGIGDVPQVAVCMDDGTADNRIVVVRRPDRQLACAVTRAGETVELAMGEVADGADFRAVVSWTGEELVAVLDAAAEVRAPLAGTSVGLATLRIGRDAEGQAFSGYLRHVAIFPASGAVTL